MAIAKKGLRKIVVDGKNYNYKISSRGVCYHDSLLRVVVENEAGKVKAFEFERDTQYQAFTPKDVATLIKERGI